MPAETSTITLSSKGFTDVIDITQKISKIVSSSPITDGTATVFVPGSTAAVTTIEFESGAVSDLGKAVERLFPRDIGYDHDARWGDGNGFAHVRSAMVGPSLTVPFSGGALLLGTWQQIVLVDFDNRPRRREVIVQIVG